MDKIHLNLIDLYFGLKSEEGVFIISPDLKVGVIKTIIVWALAQNNYYQLVVLNYIKILLLY